MVIDPVYLIVGLIVWALVGYAAKWAIAELGVPAMIGKLILILLVVLFLLWLLNALGVFLTPIHIRTTAP